MAPPDTGKRAPQPGRVEGDAQWEAGGRTRSLWRLRPPRGLPRGPVRVLRGPAVGRRLGGRRDPRRADQRRLTSPRQPPEPSPAPARDGRTPGKPGPTAPAPASLHRQWRGRHAGPGRARRAAGGVRPLTDTHLGQLPQPPLAVIDTGWGGMPRPPADPAMLAR